MSSFYSAWYLGLFVFTLSLLYCIHVVGRQNTQCVKPLKHNLFLWSACGCVLKELSRDEKTTPKSCYTPSVEWLAGSSVELFSWIVAFSSFLFVDDNNRKYRRLHSAKCYNLPSQFGSQEVSPPDCCSMSVYKYLSIFLPGRLRLFMILVVVIMQLDCLNE